jgi:TonB family protein
MPLPMPEPDPSKPISSATGALRARPEDASFEADFADLAARFAAQSGGGLSPELSADLALEIVLNEVVEQACLATGATGAAIALERGGEMICRATSGSTAPELGAHLDSASGLSGECIRTRRTQRCDDVLADLRVDIEASARLGVRAVMVMPLLREAELVGVFELFSSLPSAFGERDERTLEALAGRILSNLALRSQDLGVQPLPLGPEPVRVSEPTPSAKPVQVSETTVSPAPASDRPVSARPASENIQEFVPAMAESSTRRGFDFVTTFLGAAVLVCAVLLGVLLGRHFGFQKAAVRAHPAVPISNANSVASVPVESLPTAVKAVNSAPPASARVDSDTLPPGSLRVYDNGKEVFRQSPKQSEAELDQGELLSAEQGSGMQRAASVVPENATENAPENAPEKVAAFSPAAVVLHRVEPDYPEKARQMQLQGPVVLDVRINQDGGVQEMNLVSGQPLLAQAAKDAVKQWRFKPRTVNGRAATMQTRITLNFRLPQ